MKYLFTILILLFMQHILLCQRGSLPGIPAPGYESRIRNYIDSLRIIDTHEHLFDPELVKNTYFMDFMLLFQQNSYNDLRSAGMPDSTYEALFNRENTPVQKWKIIEPYWKLSFNTTFNHGIVNAARDLYGIENLSESTVTRLSERIRKAYSTNWFERILRDSCRIDYVIQNGYYQPGREKLFRYAVKFDDWLSVRSKYRIDSLAIMQLDPIFSVDDLVKSMRIKTESELKRGMVAIKIAVSYSRPLSFEPADRETARKVFRNIVNGDEGHRISFAEAKPLQDYLFFQLLEIARDFGLPVAIHTGLQAGYGNDITNSNPALLHNVFKLYPDVNFVLFHGSYPYGGELATIAKTYRNVFIDMNWVYSISPSYSERYLREWLETVPAGKIMAFGGDFMAVENVYSEFREAKMVISDVLSGMVKNGDLTEEEALTTARLILHDNAVRFYNLK